MFKFQKKQIDSEMKIYRDRCRLDIEAEMLELKKKVVASAERCAVDRYDFECEFHQDKEQKSTELAKLDAKIEEREKWLAALPENSVSEIIKILKEQVANQDAIIAKFNSKL